MGQPATPVSTVGRPALRSDKNLTNASRYGSIYGSNQQVDPQFSLTPTKNTAIISSNSNMGGTGGLTSNGMPGANPGMGTAADHVGWGVPSYESAGSGGPEALPEITALKGTKAYREQAGIRQAAKERNYRAGYSLEQMGVYDEKERGRAGHSAERFFDEYGPGAQPRYEYDLSTGMMRDLGTSDVNPDSPTGRYSWQPIPASMLKSINDWQKYKASAEGQEYANAYGGSMYAGWLRRDELKRQKGTGEYWTRVGKGIWADYGPNGIRSYYNEVGKQIPAPAGYPPVGSNQPPPQWLGGAPPPGYPAQGQSPTGQQYQTGGVTSHTMQPPQYSTRPSTTTANPYSQPGPPQPAYTPSQSANPQIGNNNPGGVSASGVGYSQFNDVDPGGIHDIDGGGDPSQGTNPGNYGTNPTEQAPTGVPNPNDPNAVNNVFASLQTALGNAKSGSSGGPDLSPTQGMGGAAYTPYTPQGPSPQEQQMLNAVTELARMLQGQGESMFNIGMPAYAKAIEYYKTLLGGNRAAMGATVAPAQESIREQYTGARNAIGAGFLRGGAKDQALAELGRSESSDISHLTQGVQPAAANALLSGGLSGTSQGLSAESAAGGFYNAALTNLTQGRQFEEGLAESSNQFSASLAEQVRANNMSYNQAMAGLSLQKYLTEMNLAEQTRQFNLSWQQTQDQLDWNRKNNPTGNQQWEWQKKEADRQNKIAWGSAIAGVIIAL